MQLISYAETIEQVEKLISHGINEIIISCKELSRFHQNDLDSLLLMNQLIIKNKCRSILEWDVLFPENTLTRAMDIFLKIPLHDFSGIRLQDPGIVYFIKNKYSWLPIQLILETGNHNLIALMKWEEYLGSQLDRLVLSNELSKEHIAHYATSLKTPIEILVFGRILLFYSPRKLLSPLEKEEGVKKYIEAFGTSEESPHSGFPIIENTHGTFMFNVKDLSLIENLDEIKEMGVAHARLDLRFDHSINQLDDLLNYQGPRPLIKGFYQINKTDVLFAKLKNKKTNRKDLNFLGVVVDVERDKGLAVLVKAPSLTLSETSILKIITPEGKEKTLQNFSLKNLLGDKLRSVIEGDVVICTYINGVTVKSQIYYSSSTT